MERDEDTNVIDNESKKRRPLSCGTEKGKHKCKNAKTAGKSNEELMKLLNAKSHNFIIFLHF